MIDDTEDEEGFTYEPEPDFLFLFSVVLAPIILAFGLGVALGVSL